MGFDSIGRNYFLLQFFSYLTVFLADYMYVTKYIYFLTYEKDLTNKLDKANKERYTTRNEIHGVGSGYIIHTYNNSMHRHIDTYNH